MTDKQRQKRLEDKRKRRARRLAAGERPAPLGPVSSASPFDAAPEGPPRSLLKPEVVYELLATELGPTPAPTRTLALPGDLPFDRLQAVLQAAFGYPAPREHAWRIGGYELARAETSFLGLYHVYAEARYRLSELVPQVGARFAYVHALAGGPDLDLVVGAIRPKTEGEPLPRLLGATGGAEATELDDAAIAALASAVREAAR